VPRLSWPDVDTSIREQLEACLGANVVDWQSQEEGFSPGLAARCRLVDQRRVFIKAVAGAMNERSRAAALREVATGRLLPAEAPAPQLIAAVDDGEWVAAVWADIDGRLPGQPWTEADLGNVMATVDALRLPPVLGVPPVAERLVDSFNGWRTLADGRVTSIEHWLDTTTLRYLAEIESAWQATCPPEGLIHSDIRADNLLIDDQDQVWIVDWANAALGPPWFDVVTMIPSIAMQSGREPADIWALSDHASTVDPAAVDTLVVALAGYFTAAAQQPSVATIPMLRRFQDAQARPARHWLRQRLALG
jgi:aminoglycoside phosphotransferase (APT) family kinase protein